MHQREAALSSLKGALELSDERFHLQGNVFIFTINPQMTTRSEINIEALEIWPLNINNSIDLPP